ncbi:hypothetical protein ABZ863_20430 [Saccharomonospora sp. NPDC046836]|uniref:hypothetical protein n=1 Tax=Saccharomonospora sp. NPDC046836 TaxID=3156921 RepID=UPI0033E6A6AC
MQDATDLAGLRRWVRGVLGEYHPRAVSDGELLVNELATLALTSGTGPYRVRLLHEPNRCLRVELARPAALSAPVTLLQRCGVELVYRLASAGNLDETGEQTLRVEFDLSGAELVVLSTPARPGRQARLR